MISHSQIYRARAALDLTFVAPKSITLQALIGGDERLIQANDDAVATALTYVEQHLAMGRRKENGKSRVEHTGNLIIAKFRHETARPSEDAAPDPHLHVHALLMNLTQRADGQWVALSNEQIFQLLQVTDSIYQAALERNVRALDYAVRHEKNHIELAHISREQIEFFSKRSAGITAELAARGTSRDQAPHALRQGITLAHRRQKTQAYSRAAAPGLCLHHHGAQRPGPDLRPGAVRKASAAPRPRIPTTSASRASAMRSWCSRMMRTSCRSVWTGRGSRGWRMTSAGRFTKRRK